MQITASRDRVVTITLVLDELSAAYLRDMLENVAPSEWAGYSNGPLGEVAATRDRILGALEIAGV